MPSPSLISLLRSPKGLHAITEDHWSDIVVTARKSQLLGQFAARLRQANMLDVVPAQVRLHLELDLLTARRRSESAMWEVASMRRVIESNIPLVFIKGCAYTLSDDDNAIGRTFSDIDVLVRRAALEQVESTLFSAGWKPVQVDEYDSAYYRNWMHEVPPMEHVRRNTVVDLHHAINPPISRCYINPDQLFRCLVEIKPGIFVLSAVDRVIHCAVHLLQEGEPKKLLRDLYDLYLLVSQHCTGMTGVKQLRQRSNELNVEAQVMTAVGASMTIFDLQPFGVGLRTSWLQACVVRAALAAANGRSSKTSQWVDGLAGTVVWAHSHWMKMPLYLLIPHLLRKGFLWVTSGKSTKL